MKKLALMTAALALAASTAASAQTYGRQPQPPYGSPGYTPDQDNRDQPDQRNRYDRDRSDSDRYDRDRYDNSRRDASRVDAAQEERWRHRYARDYRPEDDPAYRECQNKPDPGGVLAGAILGGILGNAAGGRAPGTLAGVVAGGAIGAALTSKMDCNDRSYAYRTYSTAFDNGRANADYHWRNPDNGDRGDLHVLDYYRDEDGFRCAVFAHTVYVHGRREEARGRACKQPDGRWAIID